ncbi:unnamed protein product [Prunus armeniaca]
MAISQEPRIGASLLRLHFQDCFVNVIKLILIVHLCCTDTPDLWGMLVSDTAPIRYGTNTASIHIRYAMWCIQLKEKKKKKKEEEGRRKNEEEKNLLALAAAANLQLQTIDVQRRGG